MEEDQLWVFCFVLEYCSWVKEKEILLLKLGCVVMS